MTTPLQQLAHWQAQGWLKALDVAFAEFLHSQSATVDSLVLQAAALLSQQLGQGEVYLDLTALNPSKFGDELGQQLAQHSPVDWLKALQQASDLVALAEGNTPLVLDLPLKRLYLRRYWQYQQTVNHVIQRLLQPVSQPLAATVKADIERLFASPTTAIDWQKMACLLALRAKFSIITGGPGTGKTTTLTKLLAVLINSQLAENADKQLNILLAAPTGKAAARVSESINKAVDSLNIDDAIKQQMPRKATTLHRLLGSRPNTRQYHYHPHNRLLADVVIVDEASMIDLEMMAALLAALPDQAGLILLGDKEQLASVEPGSVLGDLCHGAGAQAYTADTLAWLGLDMPAANSSQPCNQQTTVLQHSYRFVDSSGIGHLAKAVNGGDFARVHSVLNQPDYTDLNPAQLNAYSAHRQQPQPDSALNLLQQLILPPAAAALQGYRQYRWVISQKASYANLDDWAQAVLQAFDGFRVLSPLRRGPWGVEGLNQHIAQWLGPETTSAWYEGRPVMITSNDYGLGLMNGDIGIALKDPHNKLRVAFPCEQGIQWLSPLRLPNVETAYAMTVHKSQGSEFEHVVLVLPDQASQVLSRELIYTGITRAKQHFTLLEAQAGMMQLAVENSCR